MIYLYSGTPGSGKSLDMARSILVDLKQHKPIICNFPIYLPKKKMKYEKYFHFMENSELTPKYLYDFSREYFKTHRFGEGKIVLYLDECQLMFNARQWNAAGRDDWLKFFTNHRHYGFDIVLACQFDRMIDRQIRCLIETEVLHRKCSNMGWYGNFFRIIFLSPVLFVKVHFYYPTKLKTGTQFFKYNRRYASIYNSYSTVFAEGDADAGGPEQPQRYTSNKWMHIVDCIGICLCAVKQWAPTGSP